MNSELAQAISALAILRREHQELLMLFENYQRRSSQNAKSLLLRRLCEQTRLHFTIEAGVFYPALFKNSSYCPVLAAVGEEYAEVIDLVNELADPSWIPASRQRCVVTLSKLVQTHVTIAEVPGGLFETATKQSLDWPQVEAGLLRRRRELEG